MPIREGNDASMPYRSPVTPAPASIPYSQDEQDYRTLTAIQQLLDESVTSLYKEFNAFDVLSDGTDEEKRDKLMRQIAGNQIAFDILTPLLERVNNAINKADNNYKQRNSQ